MRTTPAVSVAFSANDIPVGVGAHSLDITASFTLLASLCSSE